MGDFPARTYKAIIWKPNADEPGVGVEVLARSLAEKTKLEAGYGIGSVFHLHNEDDASRPR